MAKLRPKSYNTLRFNWDFLRQILQIVTEENNSVEALPWVFQLFYGLWSSGVRFEKSYKFSRKNEKKIIFFLQNLHGS